MRMRIFFPVMALLAVGLASGSAAALADFHCVQTLDSRNTIVCAPPRGELMKRDGKYICGPGRCVVLSSGKVMCSPVPGGAVAVNSRGRPLCVSADGSGCVEASESYCVKPVSDPRKVGE